MCTGAAGKWAVGGVLAGCTYCCSVITVEGKGLLDSGDKGLGRWTVDEEGMWT